MTVFSENVHKPQFSTLNPLSRQIKIFFQIYAMTLSLLYGCPNSWKISEKTNEQSPTYFKDNRLADRRMDQLTYKGDYYEPYQVNRWSNIEVTLGEKNLKN